jgi:hypothetical protein
VIADRRGLDVYLRSVNEEIQTTKMSSELWFRSPSQRRIRSNDRVVRSLIHEGLRWNSSASAERYWDLAEQARDVSVHFGAAGHRSLDEYFTTDPRRAGEASLARLRNAVTIGSPADRLLRSVSDAESPAVACRQAMASLASADDQQALLTPAVAREFAAAYMLSRYCYTAEEFRVAADLVELPRLRGAMLAAQFALTTGSATSAGSLAERLGTPRALLPFTEAFVNRHGYHSSRISLCPNPKLITVLCNNVVPAIAGVLLRRGAQELDGDIIRDGVAEARRRHVFEVMIALFNQGPDGMVRVSGFNLRVCPALAPFTTFLENWLPRFF